MHGLHLTADLTDCRCAPHWLTDAQRLLDACTQAVQQAGLQTVGRVTHRFPAGPHGPGGVTATLLLAESHLCVHTWPETASVTADVYVCNHSGDHSARAHQVMNQLVALFQPQRAQHHALQRGAGPFIPVPRAPGTPPPTGCPPMPGGPTANPTAAHEGCGPHAPDA